MKRRLSALVFPILAEILGITSGPLWGRDREAPPPFTEKVQNKDAGKLPTAKPILGSLDEKNGFRNYLFGMGIEEYQNLKPMPTPSSGGAEQWFRVEKFEPKLGDGHISSIMLAFEQNMLKKIVVDAEGKENAKVFRETLSKAFGEGDTPHGPLSQDLIWEGHRVVLCFVMTGEDARSSFTSSEIERKLENLKAKGDKKSITSPAP